MTMPNTSTSSLPAQPDKAVVAASDRAVCCFTPDLEAGRDTPVNNARFASACYEDEEAHFPRVDSPETLCGLQATPLPCKKGSRGYRYLRWNFGSVYRRIFTLAFLGNMVAIVAVVASHVVSGAPMTSDVAITGVAANVLASIGVRNEHTVNCMFIVFATWPHRLPLAVRRLFAKVYSYGGIHSGCGVAAVFWYALFLVYLTKEYLNAPLSIIRGYNILASYAVILLLITIVGLAHPRLRIAMHNSFENSHRYLGWTAVALLWAQTLLTAADSAERLQHRSMGMTLVTSPAFWMLVVITLLIIYPWSRLRLRNVEAEVLSNHCVKLNFDYAQVYYGQAVRITDSPLKETHAFAVIPNPAAPATATATTPATSKTATTPSVASAPAIGAITIETSLESYTTLRSPTSPDAKISVNSTTAEMPGALSEKGLVTQVSSDMACLGPPGKRGFCVLVSNAGDWTQKMIRNPPAKIYTRGAPQYGVLRVAGMFSPVIVMATGSGIGPCLSLFVQKPDHPVRIIWSTPRPLETYGQAVIDIIYRSDPGAIIIDTHQTGRPDLVKIAHSVWDESYQRARMTPEQKKQANRDSSWGKARFDSPCEAVVIISNQKVTQKVVYGLESRGIHAYGAIFDS